MLAYSASRTASMRRWRSPAYSSAGPRSTRLAATRSVFIAEMIRLSTAALIVGIAAPTSRAFWLIHFPVPFCCASSRITSTSGRPVSGSTAASTAAVISIRYDFSSPWFHSRKISCSSVAVRPSPRDSRSYDSAISCMSPYSIPLWTIFTKWPAPPGPMYSTHGAPSSAFAAMARRIGASASHASTWPPGMMLGPHRAPCSPPDTPVPT